MNQEANGVLIFLPYIVFRMNKWIRCRHHSHFNLRFVFIQLVVIFGLAEKEKKKTCIRNSFRSSLKRGFCLNIHSVSANQKKCPLTSNICFLLVLIQKWCFSFPSKKVLLSIIFVVVILKYLLTIWLTRRLIFLEYVSHWSLAITDASAWTFFPFEHDRLAL